MSPKASSQVLNRLIIIINRKKASVVSMGGNGFGEQFGPVSMTLMIKQELQSKLPNECIPKGE